MVEELQSDAGYRFHPIHKNFNIIRRRLNIYDDCSGKLQIQK
jgi:hypothetical protein